MAANTADIVFALNCICIHLDASNTLGSK